LIEHKGKAMSHRTDAFLSRPRAHQPQSLRPPDIDPQALRDFGNPSPDPSHALRNHLNQSAHDLAKTAEIKTILWRRPADVLEPVPDRALDRPKVPQDSDANAAPGSSLKPPDAPPKHVSLAARILQLRPRSNLLARLVDLMEPREEALTEKLRKEVYCLDDDDESEVDERPFKRLVYRTNEVLRELEYSRRLKYTAHLVFWENT
jgi:hypothetical protein